MPKKNTVKRHQALKDKREIELLKKSLVLKCWVESGYSDDLYQVTSRLEEYAKGKVGAKTYCDRVYGYLGDLGIYTTEDVQNIIAEIAIDEYLQSVVKYNLP